MERKKMVIVSVTAIIALSIAVIMIFSPSTINDVISSEEVRQGTIEAVEELPPEATSEKPVRMNKDPEITFNSTETIAMSYYNLGFEECRDGGARIRMNLDDENADLTYQSSIVSIPEGNSSYIPIAITASESPGSYRAEFEVVCQENVVGATATSIVVTRG